MWCVQRQASRPDKSSSTAHHAKYVFLFIGDGLGQVQTQTAELYLNSSSAKLSALEYTAFPSKGFTSTYSSDSEETDSAAACTAIACGIKTITDRIAMDGSGTKACKTYAEYAKEHGRKTGIVSTTSLDHATPACFYAHQPSRNAYHEIAMELSGSNVDYFAGGGLRIPEKNNENAWNAIKEQGYRIISEKKEFTLLNPSSVKVYVTSNQYQEGKSLFYEIDRPPDQYSLAELTKKGIELLYNEKGFFLMVEGGKIDWALHANDAATAIRDIIAFNDAVREAVQFYKLHPEETLIVVTGDHEAGGMGLDAAHVEGKVFADLLNYQGMSFYSCTQIVQEYAKSHPRDAGNLSIFHALLGDVFGFHFRAKPRALESSDEWGFVLTDDEVTQLQEAFAQSMIPEKERMNNAKLYLLYEDYDPLTLIATRILDRRAGISWLSLSHTSTPVITYALGVRHKLFAGSYDNTDIFKKMIVASGFSNP